MKITKKQLADCLYTPTTRDDLDRLNSDAREALFADTLEIEGYEKTKWTKFDPNDPKTHPPCNGERFLIAAQDLLESPAFTMMVERATQKLLERMPRDIRRYSLNVYWRPL